MPSMSPTMEQGNIGQWKVKEGQAFTTGDVLLTIETDKAEIDVEAQDDGKLGRIVKGDGSQEIKVGEIIALLSEDGDSDADLDAAMSGSSDERASGAQEKTDSPAPPEQSPSKAQPQPKKPDAVDHGTTSSTPAARESPTEHGLPDKLKGFLPSVVTLCLANGIEDPSQIKATGPKGLTKGDVLAYLGKISHPGGSLTSEVSSEWTTLSDFQRSKTDAGQGKAPKSVEPPTPAEIRRAIMTGLTTPFSPTKPTDIEPFAAPDFESVLRGYLQPEPIPSELRESQASSATSIARSLPHGDPLREVLEA